MRARHKHLWLWPWQTYRRCLICGRFQDLAVGEATFTIASSYAEIQNATAPSNPSANFQRLYCDSGNSNKLTLRDSSGNTTVYQAATMGMKVTGSGFQSYASVTANDGSYREVVASTAAAIYLAGIELSPDSTGGVEDTVLIATGGAGSETVVSTFDIPDLVVATSGFTFMFPAFIAVAASTRIAIKTPNNAVGTISVGLIYVNQADVAAI